MLSTLVSCIEVYIPLLLLPNQPDVWLRLTVAFRFARVFGPVKNQNLSRCAFGGNQIGVLRHVPRLVDFPGMDYLLDDLNFGCGWNGVATHLPSFFIPFELPVALRELDGSDLKVIRGLIGGVGAE